MDNLSIFLVIVLLGLIYIIYSAQENMETTGNNSSQNLCNKVDEYQTNEVDYAGVDVESKYFNELQRNMVNNERKLWLENQNAEQEMQQTHECRL